MIDDQNPRPDSERLPFHDGERAVQARVGVESRMRDIGRRVIRDFMPEQHREFYMQLPFIVAGASDAQGRPWASLLVGRPGFIAAPDPRRLAITALPGAGDPLRACLVPGAALGLLGIELHTRRRNRANGRVRAVRATGFDVDVEQTVGNCPQYIQGREARWQRAAQDVTPRAVDVLDALDAAACAQIEAADTLFVASRGPSASGADVSHRGGRQGFVRIDDAQTLTVPDFSGNNLFMTLGNFTVDPRAGLSFVDFATGTLLCLTGRVELLWDAAEIAGFDGAERAWRFRLSEACRLHDTLPLRWTFRDWSPRTLATGGWPDRGGETGARKP
ncbi:MAG: pyridoxamine 5'-phosphate oxidase family protein [Gammaproteobacteria bacterium]